MRFVWISDQTAIGSLHIINVSVFITDVECLLRGTDWGFKSDKYSFVLKGLIFLCITIENMSCTLLLLLLLLTAIGLSPGGSGYFTCIQNIKLVTNKFKSGGPHEKHVVATCNLGNHLRICL